MKVLLITSFFPPTRTDGTEMRTLSYALELQKLGHEVQVVCVGKWDEGEQYWNGYVDDVYQEIHVRRINLNWVLAPDPNQFLYRNPIVEGQIGQWLDEWQPDMVHITSCLTLSASVIRAVKDHQLPLVLTLTDYWFICPKLSLRRGDGTLCDGCITNQACLQCMLSESEAYRRLLLVLPETTAIMMLEWVSTQPLLTKVRGLRGMALDIEHRRAYLTEMINAADCVTAPSSYLGAVFKISGISRPIKTIRSGHDLTWLTTTKKKSDVQVRIGFIGQMIPVKGLHILLPAFSSAAISGRARLSIFGSLNKSSDYWQQLDALINSDTAIQFHGAFPHDRLGEVLSEIDILVVPSIWHENNPRVIQEAFASKTPVIASRVGGIYEFVKHDVNGLLFEPGNVEDLARQLQRVVNEPDLLERLRGGIPDVKKIEEEVNELVNIYTGLIQSVGTRQK